MSTANVSIPVAKQLYSTVISPLMSEPMGLLRYDYKRNLAPQ